MVARPRPRGEYSATPARMAVARVARDPGPWRSVARRLPECAPAGAGPLPFTVAGLRSPRSRENTRRWMFHEENVPNPSQDLPAHHVQRRVPQK